MTDYAERSAIGKLNPEPRCDEAGSPADILIEPPGATTIIRPDGAKAFMTNEIADQTRVSIFIVDDHPVVRDGLKSLLEREPDLLVCGEAAGAATALEQITRALPDIVLLDISLSQGSGLELLKDMTIQHPKMPVVVLSMHDETVYAERAIRAGARGYLMKGESSAQVVSAIRRVLAGKVFLGDRVCQQSPIVWAESGNRRPDREIKRSGTTSV